MNESTFLAAVKARLPSDIFAWKINDRFAAGVPDLYLAAKNGKSLWIEFKFSPKPPVKPVKPRLSSKQENWLLNHHALGHNVLVIVGSPAGSTIFFPGATGFVAQPQSNLSYDQSVEIITRLQ